MLNAWSAYQPFFSSQPTEASVARERCRTRSLKIWLLLAIGVCFWFSVPYQWPISIEADHVKASSDAADSFQGSVGRQIAVPVILFLTAWSIYRLPKLYKVCWSSKGSFAAVLYVVWCALSVAWSTEPTLTAKRLFVFGVNVAFIFALARLTEVRELALLGFVCTSVVVFLSLFADCFLLQDFRPWDPDYRFMGTMTANYQAMNLYVCLVCGLTLLLLRSARGKWLIPMLALCSVLLFLTRARIGSFLFAGSLLPLGARWMRLRLSGLGRALCVLVIVLFVLPTLLFVSGRSGGSALQQVFMMGRSDTENTSNLSNRAPLWSELSEHVAERPLLGYGFEAFWTPERVQRVSLDQGWVVPHAHNSYLDQTLSLGVTGAVLYTALLLLSCFLSWRHYVRSGEPETLLCALLISWLLLLGITESIPIAPHLPSLLAYSCVLRTFMTRVAPRQEADRANSSGVLPSHRATRQMQFADATEAV